MNKIFKKKQLLKERAVEYDPQHPERMHPDIERSLSDRSHYLGSHPAFPPSVGNQHFEEKIASSRFKDAISKAKRYTNSPTVGVNSASKMMDALGKVIEIETPNRERLERLAVNLVKREMGIKDEIDFIPELNRKKITTAGLSKTPKKEEGDLEMEFDDTAELENVEDEVKKRRMVNAITQGAAKKGHYMYHIVDNELSAIDPNLVSYYGIVMSVNDLFYWLLNDDTLSSMSDESNQQAGRVNIGIAGDENDPRPKNEIPKDSLRNEKYYVYAQGIIFPTLVHELIKGVMEVLSFSSLPEYEDKEKQQKIQNYIMDRADFLKAESWDIRLGPGIWEKFLDAIGEDADEIKFYLYQEVIKMPTNEFNTFMKELLSGTKKGKETLSKLAGEIKRDIIKDRYEQAEYEREMGDIERDVKSTEDDFMKDLLSGTNITFSGMT